MPPLVSARWECFFEKWEKVAGYGSVQNRYHGSVIYLEGSMLPEIVTSIITPKGPVIVPIQIDSQTVGGAKSSSVRSIYGKKVSLGGDSILQRLKDGALVYADPEQAQVAVTGRGSVTPIGVNASEAQFSDARPIEVQDSSLADSVKPLNPH